MNFLRGFSLNAFCTGFTFSLGLVNHWLLANYLGKTEYGRLTLWTNAAMIGAILLGEWLRRGSTFVVGKERVGAQARDNALVYCMILFVLALGLAYVGAGIGARFLGPEASEYWPLLAALPALFVLQRAGLAILLGEDRIRLYAIIPVLFVVVYLGGNVVLWLGDGLRFARALGIFAAAAGITGLVAFVALGSLGHFGWGDGAVLRRTFEVGVRGAASVGLIFLLLRSDVFLIEHFLSAASVGSYRVATNFAEMMQRLPDVAGAVLLAKVVRGEDKRLLSLRVAQGILLFSILTALFLLVAGRALIGFFFPTYPEAFEPLVWMLPGLVFLGFGSVCNTKLAGRGYPAIALWAAALAFVLNLGLGLWLIPELGLRGAALSKSISYAVWAILVGGYYLRGEGLGWGTLLRLWDLAATLKKNYNPKQI